MQRILRLIRTVGGLVYGTGYRLLRPIDLVLTLLTRPGGRPRESLPLSKRHAVDVEVEITKSGSSAGPGL